MEVTIVSRKRFVELKDGLDEEPFNRLNGFCQD